MSNESAKPANELILTLEELKVIESEYGFYNAVLLKVIVSHTLLLFANAELAQTVVKQNSANLKLVYENDELMAENEKLKWICQRSSDFIAAMIGFTGGNMQVYGWHLNDSPEPFDNFVEENLEENLVNDLKTLLEVTK